MIDASDEEVLEKLIAGRDRSLERGDVCSLRFKADGHPLDWRSWSTV